MSAVDNTIRTAGTAAAGWPTAPAEARASGRAEQLTMTANAKYDNHTLSQEDVIDF